MACDFLAWLQVQSGAIQGETGSILCHSVYGAGTVQDKAHRSHVRGSSELGVRAVEIIIAR